MTDPKTGALFANKYGEFRKDGRAYIIRRHDTPRPWINVVSNGTYGFIVSQNGGGFSWWENANLARLTSWSQDLVRDDAGKFLFIRDDETGEFWSASYKPVAAPYEHYEVEHGIGYTVFTQRRSGIETRWTLTVAPGDPVEIWRVQVRNVGNRPRTISLFTYMEWSLGTGIDWHREFQKTFIETLYDAKLGALVGIKRRLPIPPTVTTGQSEWTLSAFHASNLPVVGHEGDKEGFLGRYGSLQAPEAVRQGKLTQTTGRWGDPIGSLQVRLELPPGQSEETIFLLGKFDSSEAAETLIKVHGSTEGFHNAIEGHQRLWEPFLSGLTVETPDPAFDLMTNTWMKYQAICGRIWACAAFYQSSAAYGYRDQLQDSQVFLPLNPELTKQQIALHAKHQYRDGTVLHWWYTLVETGPKSLHSDTPLWLVYVMLSYLEETANLGALRETAPYLDAPAASLYDHCAKSLELALARVSKRGLPLILHGDWNDGMSAVGPKGKGESIWQAHFLYDILQRWAVVCDKLAEKNAPRIRGLTAAKLSTTARRYRSRAASLRKAINRYAWDGQWYWRATRDDGRLVGSKKEKEGKIFLNAQTWSVISGTATPERAKTAMASMEKHLNLDYGPLLLTPAYTQPDHSIGYLSRYAPGVRENGGVYSHAATWAIIAECIMGRGDAAFQTYSKICPPKRCMDPDLYAAEPYVMPGNSDGPETPSFGRAGWTWYTGSAAWLFRVAAEWILGVRPTWEGLLVDPCIPAAWDRFSTVRRFRGATYVITVDNPDHVNRGIRELRIDGQPVQGACLPDLRDGAVHQVRAVLGAGQASPALKR